MNANEIIIPCRLSYANIWEPKQVNGTGDPKYSCCLLIKKSDTAAIAKLKAAIEAVKKDPKALARWGGSVPKNLKLPLRDGDTEKDDENYEGCYFLNANASENRRPKIIDRACNDVLDRGVQRLLRQGQDRPVLLQRQRQQGHRRRAGGHPESPRRRAALRRQLHGRLRGPERRR